MFTTITRATEELATLIKNATNTYVITGAGISTPAGIPDLAHLPRQSAVNLSDESALRTDPQVFWRGFHRIFVDPIFTNGPTTSHRVLAQLEHDHLINGIVTTNVDYLHELSGNRHVADIWGNLNTNYCLICGRTYPIDTLRSALPVCPNDGGLLSPAPIHHHIGIDEVEYHKANAWMDTADLVITIGSNGYYDNVPRQAKVVNINPHANYFDRRADLTIHAPADAVLGQLSDYLK